MSLSQYDTLLQKSIERYGNYGIGVLIIRLQYLLELEKNLMKNSDASLKRKERILLNDIIDHYSAERTPQSTLLGHIYQEKTVTGDFIYGFDPVLFEERYGHAKEQVDCLVKEVNSQIYKEILEGYWYLYVIDKNDIPLILLRPIKVTNLVLNRNPDTDQYIPMVHPLLVHNRGLKVKAAGEISFLLSNGNIIGVVANTKSGHFRPHPNSIEVVRKSLAINLNISESNVVVLPVGVEQRN